MDDRLALLTAWVAQQWDDEGHNGTLESVSGDASFRRYFRFSRDDCAYIAVDAPPDKEDNVAFISLSNFLLHHGVRSPNVIGKDLERGFLLLEDFGDQLLLPMLEQYKVDDDLAQTSLGQSTLTDNKAKLDHYYGQALDAMLRMQQMDCGDCQPALGRAMPLYSQQALRDELMLFPEWFLEAYLGMRLSTEEHGLLDRLFVTLEQSALDQPQVFVHRDYHARNIMLLEDGQLGIIDFQDGVLGPISYDLVSLLRDCYIRWPLEWTQDWVKGYWQRLIDQGLLEPQVEFEQFLQWFDWMGVQRHLKVAGIFARLSLRDGKPAYLNDLPRVIRYLFDVVGQYDELKALDTFLSDTVLPIYLDKCPQARSEFDALLRDREQ